MSLGDLPTSPRLTFRRMTASDLGVMADLLGSAEVMRFYPRPKTREEAKQWIEWTLENYARDGFGLWVIEDDSGEFLGDCGLTWQVVDGQQYLEIGYHVVPHRQGQGIATEGARACRELAQGRGVRRLIAITHPDNRASQRVAEKTGMTRERSTCITTAVPVVVHSMTLDDHAFG
ncbi:GNAT family N-acetyltransferase [Nocardioides sp.]|uniref:GNAT family N-acetyltransferase n=1 Tax=Nocardioides sp. TaxID=35761 RepID=UPI002C72D4ED|nr:GNAT family N-acetyltransferase [Nocardioides sp.]HXH76862.1 GNAT family N-acetyltransferase [Nocardioides sp.]